MTGVAFSGAEDAADAPKENPVAGDEPKMEGVVACKLEPKGFERALSELIAVDEAEELPPKLKAPLLKEVTALGTEEDAGLLDPKLKVEGATPLPDPTALVEEEELLKEVVITEAEPEELAPKLKTGAAAPPLDPAAPKPKVGEGELLKELVVTEAEPEELKIGAIDPTALIEEEDEFKPKLNTLGVV